MKIGHRLSELRKKEKGFFYKTLYNLNSTDTKEVHESSQYHPD